MNAKLLKYICTFCVGRGYPADPLTCGSHTPYAPLVPSANPPTSPRIIGYKALLHRTSFPSCSQVSQLVKPFVTLNSQKCCISMWLAHVLLARPSCAPAGSSQLTRPSHNKEGVTSSSTSSRWGPRQHPQAPISIMSTPPHMANIPSTYVGFHLHHVSSPCV